MQGLIRPSLPHSRRDQSDHKPMCLFVAFDWLLVQSSNSRSEATLKVTFEGTFKFSFDIRRMEDVPSFF